jgi:hypothetical protein
MSWNDRLQEKPYHADSDASPDGDAGEDEGSAAKEGNEDHLKDDQKMPR